MILSPDSPFIVLVVAATLVVLADLALTWLRRRVRRITVPVLNDVDAGDEGGDHDGETA